MWETILFFAEGITAAELGAYSPGFAWTSLFQRKMDLIKLNKLHEQMFQIRSAVACSCQLTRNNIKKVKRIRNQVSYL